MTFNGSGIRDINRVLSVSIAGILMILRVWFKTLEGKNSWSKDILNVFKSTRCGVSSNIENRVKDSHGGHRCGMPMIQISVKY